MGCSIWLPWQLLDVAQGHDHLLARGQGAQEAGKYLAWILRLILKVFQILPAPCSLVQPLGLGGKGRDRKLITRQAMGCSSHAPVVVRPFVPGCWKWLELLHVCGCSHPGNQDSVTNVTEGLV